MIFILFNLFRGFTHEMEENFKHLAHEPWLVTCGRIILKFYKKQTNSENPKFCYDIMISYMESMVKNWECFTQVVTYAPNKSKHLRRDR